MTDTTTKPKTCGTCRDWSRDIDGHRLGRCASTFPLPWKSWLRRDDANACHYYNHRPANASAEGERTGSGLA
jgi:hypothetical protein